MSYLDALKKLEEEVKKGGRPGPYVPESHEWHSLRKLSLEGGHLHRDLMGMMGGNTSVSGIHARCLELLEESSNERLGINSQSREILIQTIDVLKIQSRDEAHKTLVDLLKVAASDETVHPLAVLALAVGVESTSQPHANALPVPAGGGSGPAQPMRTWHWDLAITIAAGLLVGATSGAASGVAAGAVHGALASLVAAAAGAG